MCSLNIVFFPNIIEYSELWSFSVFPRRQCVYTHQAGRTPASQQNWQSSGKSQNFTEKNTIFNEHPVVSLFAYISITCNMVDRLGFIFRQEFGVGDVVM